MKKLLSKQNIAKIKDIPASLFIGIVVALPVTITLKLIGILETSWLKIFFPLIGCFALLILYFVILFVWSRIYLLLTYESHYCHHCAKPFDSPVRTYINEFAYHEECKPKK